MEQVEGGDLIVNRGEESRPKDTPLNSAREMNAVEGYEAAYKLAQVCNLFLVSFDPILTIWLGGVRSDNQDERKTTPNRRPNEPKCHHLLSYLYSHPTVHDPLYTTSASQYRLRNYSFGPGAHSISSPVYNTSFGSLASARAFNSHPGCSWRLVGHLGRI